MIDKVYKWLWEVPTLENNCKVVWLTLIDFALLSYTVTYLQHSIYGYIYIYIYIYYWKHTFS